MVARAWQYETPDARLRHIKFAREAEEERKSGLDEMDERRKMQLDQQMQREQIRKAEFDQRDDIQGQMQVEQQRSADLDRREASEQRFAEREPPPGQVEREPSRLEPLFPDMPTPYEIPPPGPEERQPRTLFGLAAEAAEPVVSPVLKGVQYIEEPVAAAALGAVSRSGPLGGPALGPTQQITETPMERAPIGEELVNPVSAWLGDEEEQRKAREVLDEAGLPAEIMAYFFTSPLNLLPIVGFTSGRGFLNALKQATRVTGRARTNIIQSSRFQSTLKAIQSEAGGPRVPGVGPEEVARVTPEQPKLPGLEDPYVAKADPGPPPPRKPTARGGTPDDPGFDDIQSVALKGEQPGETLIRRHDGAIRTAQHIAANEVRENNNALVQLGLGRRFRGSVVAEEEGAFSELNSLLHNPSKVASGERAVSDELRPIYNKLREGTDWEQAARVDFDPGMALVGDYFFRGWQPPEGMFTGEARGALGRSPAFRLPRVNATYDEMVEAGFKPLFDNPAEQMRHSRMMGVKYREQMKLIEQIKAQELALPDIGGAVPEGWRVPKVGPAFEGKPYANGGQVAFTRRWAVPDSLANRLENAYGKTPSLGKATAFGKTIDLQKVVDAMVFLPKRAKLVASVFQHVDFLGRSHVGAWAGFIDALRHGKPIESVYHLLKWPKSASEIVFAALSPNARARLAKLAVSDEPLIPGRKVSNRMVSEAGLGLRDETIFPELDKVISEVRAEGALAKGGKAPFRLLNDLERAWRKGLFEGTYPAAILTDVKNNIAPMVARQHPNATDEQLAGMIAKAANSSWSVIPGATSVVQNRQARWFLTRFLFSMGENEGLLRAFTGAIRGENAAYFRTRLVGTYLGMVGLASTIHFASTGEPLPFDRWIPISKDKWGPLPVGYNRDFAAPTIPIKGRSGVEVTLDLMGQMDTAYRILNPKSFLEARVSVPVRAGLTQVTGKDFFGAPVDTVGPGGILSRTSQLIQDLFAPIGAGQAGLEALRSNVEETEGLIQPGEDRLGAAGVGVQATGVNLRAETTPQLFDRIHSDVMQELGLGGTYNDLNRLQKEAVDNETEKRIGSELEMRRETSELRGQITPVSQFYRGVEISRSVQYEDQLASDAQLNAGRWAGDVWRDDLAARNRDFFSRREQMKDDFKVEFKDREPSNAVDAAIDAYWDINIDNYRLEDGTTDWDLFFGAQDDALRGLSYSEQREFEAIRQKYDTPTVTEFRGAKDVVDRFYDIPKYEGLTVEEGERLDEFLNVTVEELQRRTVREAGMAFDMLTAIVIAAEESGLSEKLLGVAIQLSTRGARAWTVNPARDEWLIRNERILARFYPDLLERELSRVQEAGLGAQAFEQIAAR